MIAITLKEDVLNKYNTSLAEILYLIVTQNKIRLDDKVRTKLITEGYITAELDEYCKYTGDYRLTSKGIDLVNNIIIDSDRDLKDSKDSLEELAVQLKEVFPKGKKEGTNKYWSEGKSIIVKRLQIFFKKYGQFSNEQILNAAKVYVSSFNGDYRIMRTLIYFIYKEEHGEPHSDLLTYIENAGEEENLSNDWITELK